jgi:hypothetical protein
LRNAVFKKIVISYMNNWVESALHILVKSLNPISIEIIELAIVADLEGEAI